MDTIIFKIDKKIKKKAQRRAKVGGFSLSDYYRHATRSLAEGATTIEMVSTSLNTKTKRELIKISSDIQIGKKLSPVFSSATETIKYLKK
jgi:hypothetical protein